MSIPRATVRFKTPLPHPGETLLCDYLEPLELSAGALAKAMGLRGRQRIERLVRGQQAITADTALRLSRVFTNTSPEFWMNLQAAHDLSTAEIAVRDELDALTPLSP
ncbi:MAG: HigA family addiction module antitoxin [Hyphomonadaceae bacterium]|nr:HigA family addiction module antitoxin [Hyphomonadaceae bacterium]